MWTFAEAFILTPISLQEVAAYCPLLIDDVKENLHLSSKDDEEFIRNSVLDVISKNPGTSYAHAAASEVSRYVWVESQTFPSEESDAATGAESW